VGKLNELRVQLLPLLRLARSLSLTYPGEEGRGRASGIFSLECPIVIRERAELYSRRMQFALRHTPGDSDLAKVLKVSPPASPWMQGHRR